MSESPDGGKAVVWAPFSVATLPRACIAVGVEHVDHAGIADRDVELTTLGIEPDDVGHAAELALVAEPCPSARRA